MPRESFILKDISTRSILCNYKPIRKLYINVSFHLFYIHFCLFCFLKNQLNCN